MTEDKIVGWLTQWTWIWASSGRWWRTGKPGMLQSMGLQSWDTTEWLNNISFSPLPFPSSTLDTFRPGGFIFWRHIFLSFIQFVRFSRQVYWGGLPFPHPVDHILSELSTMTHLSWVALPSMTHSFIELWLIASLSYEPLHHYKAVICEGDNGILLRHKKNEILSLAATRMDLENIMCACSVAQLWILY